MAVNSKKKGNRFERVISKFFKEWTGYEFSRTPQSGGLRWKKTDNITSDIVCTDPAHSRRFPFSVECKFHNDVRFDHLLLNMKSSELAKFWDQVSRDAIRANKVPMLVVRYNGMPSDQAFVFMDMNIVAPDINGNHMTISFNDHLVKVFLLKDLKNVEYKSLYKQARKWIKSHEEHTSATE